MQHKSASPETTLETTLGQARDRFLREAIDGELAEGTIDMYRQKCARLIEHMGERAPLANITPGAVDIYVGLRRGQGIKKPTIYKELVALRCMLRTAWRRGEYPHDPRRIMPLRFRASTSRRSRWLRPEELTRFLEAFERTSPGRAAAIAFMVATGARRGEMMRARREDVGATAVHLRGTKTKAALRFVPISDIGRPLLEYAIARADGPGDLMFSRWLNIRRAMLAAAKRAGIEPVTCNDLRRTFASLHAQAGAPEAAIVRALGHTSSTMARTVYVQHTAESLGRLISGDATKRTEASMVEAVQDLGSDGVGRVGLEPTTYGLKALPSEENGRAADGGSVQDSRTGGIDTSGRYARAICGRDLRRVERCTLAPGHAGDHAPGNHTGDPLYAEIDGEPLTAVDVSDALDALSAIESARDRRHVRQVLRALATAAGLLS